MRPHIEPISDARARGIPIITIARAGADISDTLQGISQNVFWCESGEDLADLFARLKHPSRPTAA